MAAVLQWRLTACLCDAGVAFAHRQLPNFLGPCKHTTRSLHANAGPIHPPLASVKAAFNHRRTMCQATGRRLPAARPKSSKSNPNSLCENL